MKLAGMKKLGYLGLKKQALRILKKILLCFSQKPLPDFCKLKIPKQ